MYHSIVERESTDDVNVNTLRRFQCGDRRSKTFATKEGTKRLCESINFASLDGANLAGKIDCVEN